MTLPSALLFALASGIGAAIAGRVELRLSPRPAQSTRAFQAFAIFTILLTLPVSLYFYVFHGDWYLLYLVDSQRIPSAVALVGFVIVAGLATAGFALGAQLVRMQRETLAGVVAILFFLASIGVLGVAPERVAQVGSYAQFHGGFGLVALASSSILPGMVLMGTVLLVGWAALLLRVGWGARRG
ncbi:MAG: hypothetical protein U0230_06025 [Polyangiales bacterium]